MDDKIAPYIQRDLQFKQQLANIENRYKHTVRKKPRELDKSPLEDALDWQKIFSKLVFDKIDKTDYTADPIVNNVIKQFIERSNIGMLKYGISMEDNKLDTLKWINHAQQEAMDFILYLERLKKEF